MNVNYDPQTDTAYIKFAEGKYKVSKNISNDIIFDYGENDILLGIEILSANETIPGFNLNEISLSISNNPNSKVHVKNIAQ